MALLATCFVLLLVPQEPSPPVPDAPATVTATPAEQLAAAEQAGAEAAAETLVGLALADDAAVAARAAWLLAGETGKAPLPALHEVVAKSPHADARAQAMQALDRRRDAASAGFAVEALHDGDVRVRTLAAQLLGKLQHRPAVEALTGLIDESRTRTAKDPSTDLQAALLALHDLGAASHLMRIATALHDSKVEGTGEALAFCCQGLGPKLSPTEQTTFLLAILGHREALVRRHAIGRLAELADPRTTSALEARLATETRELRPLIEVALMQVRRDKTPPSDEMGRAGQNALVMWQHVTTWWSSLEPTMQAVAAGAPVLGLVVLVLLVRTLRRRAADKAAAAATVALVQPSEEFMAQAAAEAEELAAEAEAAQATADAEDDVVAHR